MSTRSRLRIVVVDDHAGFRRLMGELLRISGHDVVGEAHDRSSARCVVERCAPDLVFVDVGLGLDNGFDVASDLAHAEHAPQIMLMSADECPDPARVRASGARAFFEKSRLAKADLAALGA